MVSVAFKTLSLFLALVTLPQVFAWSIEEETLANHNLARALQNAPALTWSANLAASAQAQSNLCRPGKVGTPFGGALSDGLSLCTGDPYIWTCREYGHCIQRHRRSRLVGKGLQTL